jgi:hypothetical protein
MPMNGREYLHTHTENTAATMMPAIPAQQKPSVLLVLPLPSLQEGLPSLQEGPCVDGAKRQGGGLQRFRGVGRRFALLHHQKLRAPNSFSFHELLLQLVCSLSRPPAWFFWLEASGLRQGDGGQVGSVQAG